MRSRPLIPLLLLCSLSSCALVRPSSVEPGTSPRGITTVELGFVSSHIVDVGEQGVVLVDVGTEDDWGAIEEALGDLGRAPEDILAVLITHSHADHTGGLKHLPEGTPIVAHTREAELIEQESGVAPTQLVEHLEVVELGEHAFTIYHLPGHTPGSIGILVNEVLFFGDSAVSTKWGNLILGPRFFSDDVDQNTQSLVELSGWARTQDITRLEFSHSGPLDEVEPLHEFAAAHQK